MTTFTLTELMKFLLDFHPRFEPFLEVVEILESDLSPQRKHECIMMLFRFYGFETQKNEKDLNFFTEPELFKDAINPIQLFDIKFENGKLDFWQNLN